MLKNKMIGRKIRNVVIFIMAIAIMIGIYRFIDKSQAEGILEVEAIAIDDYGYLEAEKFKLKAKQAENNLHEIELPENINGKKNNKIVKVGLGNLGKTTQEETSETLENIDIIENKIYLTKEQITNKKINVQLEYDVVILETNKDGVYNKILLSEKSKEEISKIEITNTTEMLYRKTLKYEDVAKGKVVEVEGFLPASAELQVKEVSQEKITGIFGEKKIDVAYDIKIIAKVVTEIPADEANPESKPTQIIETIEVNPKAFGETCEVSIKDANITGKSKVYHVKADNTYENVEVKDSIEGNVSFDAQTFSIYAISNEIDTVPEPNPDAEPEIDNTIEPAPDTEPEIDNSTEPVPEAVDPGLPIWEKVSSQEDIMKLKYSSTKTTETTEVTAKIKIRGTATNYASSDSDLINKIKVFANMDQTTGPTTMDITKDVRLETTSVEPVYKDETTNEQIGNEYTITITGAITKEIISGIEQNLNQIKIQIPRNTILDDSGNGNSQTEIIVYNTLKTTKNETLNTSGFLGETSIERQNIEKVIFLDNIEGSTLDGLKVWDVSATADKSILAWTNPSLVPYTVYIGSNYEIYANKNSSYLFTFVGAANICEAIKPIENINLLNTNGVTNMTAMFKNYGENKMKILNLENNFDTSNVTVMKFMFAFCGRNAMTSLDFGSKFNTSNVTDMSYMFQETGYTSMTSLKLGDLFHTTSVKNMSYMFASTGYTSMVELKLGNNFDTSSVTNMSFMFQYTGYKAMTKLELGSNFNTKTVGTMRAMFFWTGHDSMTELDLGDNFNTIGVYNMESMFNGCGNKKMTSLDLGDLFSTSEVTNMKTMFLNTGSQSMEKLDLGPLFTKIPENNANFINGAGKNNCEIYVPEAIYKNEKVFKLNSTDTTDATETLTYRGTINPIYRPEWEKVPNSTIINKEEGVVTVQVRGSANKTDVIKDSNGQDVIIKYESEVTSALTEQDITVFINGVEADWITKELLEVNQEKVTEATQTIKLSKFEETTRRLGMPYTEWSGNIQIRIGGRGEATDTYTANKLVDEYGNQSMMALDKNGTWIDIKYQDEETNINTDGIMFADFIKPDFTYKYNEADINYGSKTVQLVFTAADKYYKVPTTDEITEGKTNQLELNDLTIKIDGNEPDWREEGETSGVTKTLTSEPLMEERTKLDGTIENVQIGHTYTLLLSDLQQNPNNGFDYSGIVTVVIKEGVIEDQSGHVNEMQSITFGADFPEDGTEEKPADVVDPIIKYNTSSIDRYNGKVILELKAEDKFLNAELETLSQSLDKVKIKVLDKNGSQIVNDETTISKQITNIQKDKQYMIYTLELSGFGENEGKTSVIIPEGVIKDLSKNGNIETEILVGNPNDETVFKDSIVDFTKPVIEFYEKYINLVENYAMITLRATDKFYDFNTVLNPSDITLYEQNDDGNYEPITSIKQDDITITPIKLENGDGYDFVIKINNFNDEMKLKMNIEEGKISDTSTNFNVETDILLDLDNQKPSWEYVSSDTTRFETEGIISFIVKGKDKFLKIENSNLAETDLKIIKDGTNITGISNITVKALETNNMERSKSYQIDISGLTESGIYSLAFAKDLLVDELDKKSVATTITFSNSEIEDNTNKYKNITYHVTPDMESKHKSYVHELVSGNITTYRPSTLGELFNNGENPLFAEPMYQTVIDENTVNSVYAPKSFAGWAEADENGNAISGGTVYGLFDEIPNTVTNLRALWQDATVIFVSARNGNNGNNGKLPTEPVKDIQTAYGLLNPSGTAENNIIVIMDVVSFNSSEALNGNATITSLYAGIDYRTDNAELRINSNMIIDGDITFDNIKLYTDTANKSLISNYSGNIILGRGITTPNYRNTFEKVVGGNLEVETGTKVETQTIIIEAGVYNNIISGSTFTTEKTSTNTVSQKVVIGNKRDALIGNDDKLTISSENQAIYLGTINGEVVGKMDFEMYSGNVNGDIYGGSSIGATNAANITNNISIYGGKIGGNIYGGGIDGYGIGTSNILMENKIIGQIVFGGSIYGTGKNEKYSKSSIHLKNFGTSENICRLISVENTDNLYIGNSYIELLGKNDINIKSFTLNKIKNGLTIYDNTTLYAQRGFNKVGGFNSYSTLKEDGTGTKATMQNVDNRLYTLEGVNLIFAKQEGDLSDRNDEDIWGDVNGMTFFGMYTENAEGEKQYDETLFSVGTYVEGREKANHDITIDGFYKNTVDGTQEVIGISDFGTYYDWIIGEDVVNYEVQLIASTSGKGSVAEVVLDHNYLPNAVYTIDGISTNALISASDEDIKLVDPVKIPTVSIRANNTFGLTVETTETGWCEKEITNIYQGALGKHVRFKSDSSLTPSALRFKIHNSVNITKQNDFGFINLVLTGKTKERTFKVVIAVNIQTVVEEQKEEYIPRFKDRAETKLNYTADSKVDLSYILYKKMAQTPYETGDYRVISTTVQLPAGTKLTMKDYGQGDSLNKVYYYQVESDTDYDATEDVNGITRYLYRLDKFNEMGSINSTYVDGDIYYKQNEYAFEKYDISIDFIDSNINANKVEQETYLELRNSSGQVKYNNGNTEIKYDLSTGKNAIPSLAISNKGESYTVSEKIEIPINIVASILEDEGTLDTKYYDKLAGIAIQLVGESNVKLKASDFQEFKITNTETNEIYELDSSGAIRMPITSVFGKKSGNYKLSITPSGEATTGEYKAQVILYTADDGKYYGTEPEIEPVEFNITITAGLSGSLLSVEAEDENSRIINKSTGLNLVENSQANKAIDMTIGISKPTNATNIRVELYKRNSTYTNLNDETTYTGTSYKNVDITKYLQGPWEKPEDYGLVSALGSVECIVSARKNYETEVEFEKIKFEKAIIKGISTGEYKLVFKEYKDDLLVQTFDKTFIVTP